MNKSKGSNQTLISCGIFKKEVGKIIDKNNWKIHSIYLNSALHTNFNKLWNTLSKSLEKYKDKETLVCYGACHPLMHKLIKSTNSKRTIGQNCVELILGKTKFEEELEKGAFFLFEDWAVNWQKVAPPVFGTNPELIKEIYTSEHKYLLCINTPCSNNFEIEAQQVSKITGLPIKWFNAKLNHLEKKLKELILNEGNDRAK